MPQVIDVRATGRVDHSAGNKRCSAGLSSRGIQRYPQVHRRAVTKEKVLVVVGLPGVSLVVAKDFVVTDVCPWEKLEIDAKVVRVHSVLVVLKEQLLSALMNCRERRSIVDISGICQA